MGSNTRDNQPLLNWMRKGSVLAATGELHSLQSTLPEARELAKSLPESLQEPVLQLLQQLQDVMSPRGGWTLLRSLRGVLEGTATPMPKAPPKSIEVEPEPLELPVQSSPLPLLPPAVEEFGDVPLDWTPPDLPAPLLSEFFAEVREYLDEVLVLVLAPLTPGTEEVQELYRKLHTVKGNSGMVGLSPLQQLVHHLEDEVKALREEKRAPTDPERQHLAEGSELAVRILEAAANGSREVLPVKAFLARKGGEPLLNRAPEFAEVPVDVPLTQGEVSTAPAVQAETPREAKMGAKRGRMLRVDFGQVDRLASMVGEQAVKQDEVVRQVARIQESVETFARQVEQGLARKDVKREQVLHYLRTSARNLAMLTANLEGTTQELDFVSADLQDAVLNLRLVPLANLFKKHEMTVFRAAATLGRQARLVVEAGDTKLDKSIVEKLEEPLIHLIRNAVGHGIEPPDQRIAQGKPEEGTIVIRALPQGNQVVIRVEDDGRGIDHEVIRRKAVDKGFLTVEEAERMGPDRLVDLIFAPGFSTTAVADDVSGRGVGLDVVREKVNRLNGAVEVVSKPGMGTTFQLTLPLTLALAKVLLVEVAGETIAIPADSVLRVVTVAGSTLARVEGLHMARLDGEAVPVVFLDSALGLSRVRRFQSEATACLVNHGGRQVAFVVDRVLEHIQAVIREVGSVLPEIRGAMGVTFHEGRCVLIVDVGTVIRERIELRTSRERPVPTAFVLVTSKPDRFVFLHHHSISTKTAPLLIAPDSLSSWKRPLRRVIVDAVDGRPSQRVEEVKRFFPEAEIVLLVPASGLAGEPLDILYEGGVSTVEKWPVDARRLTTLGRAPLDGGA